MKNNSPMLFAGSSHQELAAEIAAHLDTPLGKIFLSRFPDGEIAVEILEDVQGRDVFVLQSIALDPSFYLLELLVIIDALRRSSAKSIIAIIPYFGFSRQDRKSKSGEPITAKLIANLLSVAGIDRLITIDLHAGQIEGFFEIPVDHLHCQELLAGEAKKIVGENLIAVAPDIGSIKIVKKFASSLGADFVVIAKQRQSSSQVEMTLIGTINTKNILIIDDICSTGNTLVAAAELCRAQGAEKIVAAITHGVCSGDAITRLESSVLDAIILTNTVPSFNRFSACKKFQIVSVAHLIANQIKNLRL